MAHRIIGPAPENHILYLGTLAWAGWIGMLITSINLIPIGQLDGGHVLYALLGKHAHPIAAVLLVGCIVGSLIYWYYWWALMLGLLVFFGPAHPPTQDDEPPIGRGRALLGWALLAFVIVGFTPNLIVHWPGP